MRVQSFKAPELTEAQVQQQIINALAARRWLVVRFNSGSVKAGSRFIRFYLIHALAASAGLPDVIGFKGDGSTLCSAFLCEVKDRKGKLTESQQRFRDFAARFGIVVHVVRSWEEVARLVENL